MEKKELRGNAEKERLELTILNDIRNANQASVPNWENFLLLHTRDDKRLLLNMMAL